MNKREQQEFSELEELLWLAEEVLEEPEAEYPPEDELAEDFFSGDDYGLSDGPYGENDCPQPEYGSYQPRFHNPEFDRVQYPDAYQEIPYAQPQYREERRDISPSRPAYQESYREIPEEDYVMPESAHKKSRRRTRKRRGCGCGCLTWLLGLFLAAAVAMFVFIQPPKSGESIGSRKFDTATILICGTDADGMRTDTMMLLYLSGSETRAGLLSLPRDTYTITASGNAAKLNSAYGRNGCGEEGMEVLMDYVKDIIGYRPDGYILVDFTLVPQIVDIMGGVDVDVPVLVDMSAEGITIPAGYQHLTGEQVLAVLRYRAGYATADLGRIEVQRAVLKACISQWLTPSHISGALEAISLLESASTSTLSTSNYIWIARSLLLGMGDFRSDTLPGYAEYRGGASYYILDRSEVATLIDEAYNPYKVSITEDDLNIAG